MDLTHQTLATLEVQQLLAGAKPLVASSDGALNLRQLFHEILLFFAHTYRDVFGLTKGPPLHDPLAVAILLPNSLRFDDKDGERWHVNVVTDGLHSGHSEEQGEVGRTVIVKAEEGGVRIPRGLDVHRFWTIVDECMRRAEQEIAP